MINSKKLYRTISGTIEMPGLKMTDQLMILLKKMPRSIRKIEKNI
jgi:hypothetical protein